MSTATNRELKVTSRTPQWNFRMTISLITPQYLLQQNYSLIYSGTNPEVHGEPSPGIAHFPKGGMEGWMDGGMLQIWQSQNQRMLPCTNAVNPLQRSCCPAPKELHSYKETN